MSTTPRTWPFHVPAPRPSTSLLDPPQPARTTTNHTDAPSSWKTVPMSSTVSVTPGASHVIQSPPLEQPTFACTVGAGGTWGRLWQRWQRCSWCPAPCVAARMHCSAQRTGAQTAALLATSRSPAPLQYMPAAAHGRAAAPTALQGQQSTLPTRPAQPQPEPLEKGKTMILRRTAKRPLDMIGSFCVHRNRARQVHNSTRGVTNLYSWYGSR